MKQTTQPHIRQNVIRRIINTINLNIYIYIHTAGNSNKIILLIIKYKKKGENKYVNKEILRKKYLINAIQNHRRY